MSINNDGVQSPEEADRMELCADPTEREAEIDGIEEKLINEEYKTWKKNTPYLYDLVITHALEWPTLTTQWFPDKETPPGKDYSIHRLLLGTHTSGNDQNFLQIAHIQIPNSDVDISKYDEERGETGGYNGIASRVNIVQKIPHDGEVNRARYMPQNPEMIATWSVSGDVLVFDRTKHPNHATGPCNPQIRLKGHTNEGYGLAWNPQKEGHLLTGSEDSCINAWDITSYNKEDNTLSPLRTYKTHASVVNDVAFHPHHDSLFGSVSDDCTLQIHDTRSADDTKASHEIKAHKSAINALAFNPASEYVLVTASADQTVALWDLRNLKNKLHIFEGHRNEVVGLQWSPHEEAILASSSIDRRVIIWDLSRIGEEQTPEDSEDGGPELLFMHGGHTNRISDFCWSPSEPWMMVSAAEDNVIQVWQPASNICTRGDEIPDVPVEELGEEQ